MTIILSGHAQERCQERGISLDLVLRVATEGCLVNWTPQGRETRRDKRLVVVVHRKTGVSDMIVTAFRLPKRNPKRLIRKSSHKHTERQAGRKGRAV